MSRKYVTVSQLTFALKRLIEENFLLEGVWIRGEISNFTAHSSGHLYFTLKDEGACLKCVMFKSQARTLTFKPGDGMAVAARGRITVYEKSGQYQLYVEAMEPAGLGNLYQAFEALKEKLSKEGLFDPARKRKLPPLPRCIGIITSPTGAAVRDMITILHRRRPNLHIILFPAQVQGAEAPPSLIQALGHASSYPGLDLVIIGRGGGSIEELWAFNDERLARAIAAFPLPVISAVGHETDFTIADFVADLRAPTPSAAAELSVPDQAAWERNLTGLTKRLEQAMRRKTKTERIHFERLLQRRVFLYPKQIVEGRRQELDNLQERISRSFRQKLSLNRERFGRVVAKLDALSPLATLSRGYAIARNENGKVLKNPGQVAVGEKIEITVENGILHCRVETKEEVRHGRS